MIKESPCIDLSVLEQQVEEIDRLLADMEEQLQSMEHASSEDLFCMLGSIDRADTRLDQLQDTIAFRRGLH